MSHPGELDVARDLHRAQDFYEVVAVVHAALGDFGYSSFWIAVVDTEQSRFVRMVAESGPNAKASPSALFPIDGDGMLEELFQWNRVVVIEDARTDPRTNKAAVAALRNKTLVQHPLTILDKPFGCLGMGTFGDEPLLPPTPAFLERLAAIIPLVSIAASRIRLEALTRQGEDQRREVERQLARLQRLDSVGVLAGGVAHDFNNLITVILASASLARHSRGPEDLTELLDHITGAAGRAQQLTQQLLAMSRTQRLVLADLDPAAVLEEFVPMLRRVIPASITIDLISPPRGLLIEADKTQLDQVIMNLCLNARDAMPNGGKLVIEAELVLINGAFRETHPWAKPGRYVLLSISDTGVGISPENLERIYEPFFTTKPGMGGTGLGLAVSHGIVQQHGGMLHCYSEVGIGTTFKVYLPLLAREARHVGSKIERAARGGSERILLGEDDPDVRRVAQMILERAGYDVVCVRNGQEVLDALAAMPFALVLMDVVMPGLTASETVTQIRARHPGVAILLSSGYAADPHLSELMRDGAIPFLPKPYDPERLLRALRTALDPK